MRRKVMIDDVLKCDCTMGKLKKSLCEESDAKVIYLIQDNESSSQEQKKKFMDISGLDENECIVVLLETEYTSKLITMYKKNDCDEIKLKISVWIGTGDEKYDHVTLNGFINLAGYRAREKIKQENRIEIHLLKRRVKKLEEIIDEKML